ncbi:uncharacterized protein [Watersipora subatra]|uniref:uncharacterized protein n=1 Tax=Watersipora subatra TaxID=2589382 RepID=UPI00355B7B0C
MTTLKDKVAVVTGSSSGIGEAIVRHLALAGAKVSLGARRADRLEAIKSDLLSQGLKARYTVCDVTDSSQIKRLVEETEQEFGPVDILVNNAGVMYYRGVLKSSEELDNREIDINCKGVVNGVSAVVESMTSRKSGHIINMSSNAGRRGFAGLAVYSGTKFFVEGFSQALRQELAEHNVKVSTVQPGDVKTELMSHTTDKEAAAKYGVAESTSIISADDIARAVVYIVSQPDNIAINELLVEPSSIPM